MDGLRLKFLGGFRICPKNNLKEVNLSLCKEVKAMCVCKMCVANRKCNAIDKKKKKRLGNFPGIGLRLTALI